MLGSFDYYGAAALIAAIGAVLASVFSFLNGRTAASVKIDTAHISNAVTTSNGNTLADLAEKLPIDGAPGTGTANPPPPH